jgi:hypothetical protein
VKLLTGLILAAVAALAAPAAFADKNDSKVVLKNSSDWSIHHLYFSAVDQTEWGEDQLGEQTIDKGDTFTLHGVPCGAWDVRVVDEDGDECVIENVGLCATTDTWVITNKDLLGCQAASSE